LDDIIIVRETAPNVFVELPWGQTIIDDDDVMHPWQITELWSAADLAALSIYRVTRAEVPGDKIATGYSYARNGSGIVEQVLTLEDVQPFSRPPSIVAAAFNVQIADGDVAAVGGSYNIVGVMYLDVGTYMVLLIEPQPDTNYYAVITGDAASMSVSESATDYFMIETKDSAGNPVDPSSLSIQILRIN
jgi:hypothetical protein